jgi:succinate dehydrogenase / fumarate reductase, cytochrome b subunit
LANPHDPARPTSPHLGVYKWGPSMAASIIHRATGTAMATVGALLFVWWLAAMAAGGGVYAQFVDVFTLKSGALSWLGYVVGVGFTFALFQHMASGVRHLFMDQGNNFELGANKNSAIFTLIFALLATVGFWLAILEKLNG